MSRKIKRSRDNKKFNYNDVVLIPYHANEMPNNGIVIKDYIILWGHGDRLIKECKELIRIRPYLVLINKSDTKKSLIPGQSLILQTELIFAGRTLTKKSVTRITNNHLYDFPSITTGKRKVVDILVRKHNLIEVDK